MSLLANFKMDLVLTLRNNTVTITIGAVALVLMLVNCSYRGRRKITSRGRLPPGPAPVPILGNMLQIDMSQPYRSYMELSKTYGSVFTVWLASRAVVVVCGYEAIREALVTQGEAFNGRANPPVNVKIQNGHGVGVSNGPRWKILRAFSEGSLRGFDARGGRSLEQRAQEEAEQLVRAFGEGGRSTVNPKKLLYNSIINFFCSLSLGRRFELDHPTFRLFHDAVYLYFDFMLSRTGSLYNFLPGVVGLFPGKHRVAFQSIEKVKALLIQEAESRLKNLDTSNPQDFLEVFLVRMLEEKDQPDSEFHYENMFGCVWDLFAAGTETQSSALAHAFLLMIGHPLIQEKIQKEIDEVIGRDRPPAISDRANMPYTNAVIHEIQRTMDLAPFAVPHKMNCDVDFYGHLIPEGTVVFPLLSSVLSDPMLFKNPDRFDPENFLDDNGLFLEKDGFLAYGLGRRGCLGNGMGIPKTVIFLFFVSVLQRFSLRGTGSAEDMDLRTVSYSVGKVARPYECYAEPRDG